MHSKDKKLQLVFLSKVIITKLLNLKKLHSSFKFKLSGVKEHYNFFKFNNLKIIGVYECILFTVTNLSES